jgi:hypothetical protein
MSARLRQVQTEGHQADTKAVLSLEFVKLLELFEMRMREIADEAVRAEEDLRSYSIRTVMERLEISEYLVRKMIAQGKLEVVYATDDAPRVTARSLRQFLYGNKVGSISQTLRKESANRCRNEKNTKRKSLGPAGRSYRSARSRATRPGGRTSASACR